MNEGNKRTTQPARRHNSKGNEKMLKLTVNVNEILQVGDARLRIVRANRRKAEVVIEAPRTVVVQRETAKRKTPKATYKFSDGTIIDLKTPEEVRAVWDADQKYYETQNGWISENGNDWVDAALGGAVQSVEFSRVSIRLIDGPRHGEIVG